MRKHLLTAGLIVVLLALTAIPAIADDGEDPGPPDKQKVPPRSGRHGKSGHVLLVSKDKNTWDPIWPGAFGLLKYPLVSDVFEARLIVHHLEPNEWYMVTFQGEWEPTGDEILNTWSPTDEQLYKSESLWPEPINPPIADTDSDGDDDLAWADIALFKTNEGGNANIIIPTSSGAVVPGINPDPALAPESYDDVRIVVKWVGDGQGGFDMDKLIWGTDPVLFEYESIDFEITSDGEG